MKMKQQKIFTIKELLGLIAITNPSNFIIDITRGKNRNTLKKYELSALDVIDYIKSLTEKEYDRYEKCNDDKFEVNVWYIFHSVSYLYALDNILDRVRLFIRIGIDDNENIVAVVRSFHEDDY
jgi:hypothetical protein